MQRNGSPPQGRGWYVRDEEEGLRFIGWIGAGQARADAETAAHLWEHAPSLGRLLENDLLDEGDSRPIRGPDGVASTSY